jgi:hypothetical protein
MPGVAMDEMDERTPFDRECRARGWSQPAAFIHQFMRTARDLGEDVAVTDRQVRRWRRPDPPRPRASSWRVLHAMFGMPPVDLGFPPPPPGAPGYEQAAGVERRTFLAEAVGVGVGVFAAADAVGTAHLAELREGLRSLFSLDDAYGSQDVRPLAGRHLARIRRVINTGTYPDSIGRQLHLLAGETAEHCGWLAYDADHQDAASLHWGDALTSATILGDASLQVLVMASLSLQAIHVGRPRDGLELARAARRRAEAMESPVLQSVLAAREARALAAMRDAGGAKAELAAAMRIAERPERGRPAPAWAAFHGPAELDFAQGLLYTEAGHHQAAVPFLRAALAHQDRAYGRNRALYRLSLARGLVRAGEVDEGGAEAVGALDQLAEVQSGRVTSRLAEVRDLLAGSDSTTAREPADILTDHLTRAESA